VATVINIGIHAGILKNRGQALQQAGHTVRNALTLKELEQHLRADDCDAVVVGHSLTPSEKLRVHNCAKQWQYDCPVIELFTHVPDLPSADAHVRFDDGFPALLAAVGSTCGDARQ
jgi:DNA-binding NtrC family response regulator